MLSRVAIVDCAPAAPRGREDVGRRGQMWVLAGVCGRQVGCQGASVRAGRPAQLALVGVRPLMNVHLG